MAGLTRNLFWGQGERDHRLDVIAGHWPADLAGSVVVVGPDKRVPGGHWFAEHGLLQRIDLRPDPTGRIRVDHRLVRTPVARIRRRLPWLFARLAFAEVSPFGVTNLANTNVTWIADRLFVGYDAGRPIEVDPATLGFVTAVGGNDEWLQSVPGVLEPLCAVAAHPAADVEEGCLWFVNYDQTSPPEITGETYLARWGLDGPVRRWRVTGLSPFDAIHDVKATSEHVVFADLPFVVEPESLRGAPRTRRSQDHTKLWIVAKADVAGAPQGGTVRAVEVRIPMPTGHVFLDYAEHDGRLRVVLQHIPLSDLLLTTTRDSVAHRTGAPIDPAYEGLIAQSVQPSVVGCYEIDPVTGAVLATDLVVDDERLWGGLLATTDVSTPEARAHQRQIWFAATGFDPDLVTAEWWSLYGDARDGLVAPESLPTAVVPGSLARIDLDARKVAEVWSYEAGAFPSPPTFVPRVGAQDPDDGYIVVVVHQDGAKEVQVFDAGHVADGPLARASAPSFSPSLLLHSCWVPDRTGARPSRYRVPAWSDVIGAVRGWPGVLRRLGRTGRAYAAEARRGQAP